MLNAKKCDKRYRKKERRNKRMKTLMANTVVCFVVGKLKILERKMNMTEVSEDKQRLMVNLTLFKPRIKSHLLFAGIIRSSPFSPR